MCMAENDHRFVPGRAHLFDPFVRGCGGDGFFVAPWRPVAEEDGTYAGDVNSDTWGLTSQERLVILAQLIGAPLVRRLKCAIYSVEDISVRIAHQELDTWKLPEDVHRLLRPRPPNDITTDDDKVGCDAIDIGHHGLKSGKVPVYVVESCNPADLFHASSP